MGIVAIQLVVNSVIAGMILAVMALGFHLAFRTVRVFHLAHGAVFVAGAYIYVATSSLIPSMLGVFVGLLCGMIGAGVIAFVMDAIVYRKLSNKGASQEISLISSMGLYIFLVEALALSFGNQARSIGLPSTSSLNMGGLVLAPAQILQFGACIAAMFLLLVGLRSQRALMFRAVMSQSTVASVMGVNTNVVKSAAMVLSGTLAGLAGGLVVVDTGIHPNAGLGITLSAAVAVILGGARSLSGTIMAAIGLALVQTLTEWFLNAQWKDGVTFTILIVVLLWKTEGIVAFNLRPEER